VLKTARPSTAHRSVDENAKPVAAHWTRPSGSITAATTAASEMSRVLPSTSALSALASRKKTASTSPETRPSAIPSGAARRPGSKRPGASIAAIPDTARTRATTTTGSVRCLSRRGAMSAM